MSAIYSYAVQGRKILTYKGFCLHESVSRDFGLNKSLEILADGQPVDKILAVSKDGELVGFLEIFIEDDDRNMMVVAAIGEGIYCPSGMAVLRQLAKMLDCRTITAQFIFKRQRDLVARLGWRHLRDRIFVMTSEDEKTEAA